VLSIATPRWSFDSLDPGLRFAGSRLQFNSQCFASAVASKRSAVASKVGLAARPQRRMGQRARGAGGKAAAARAAAGAQNRRQGCSGACGSGRAWPGDWKALQVAAAGEREEEDTLCSISPTDDGPHKRCLTESNS